MARYADAFFLDGLLERLEATTTLTVTAGEPTSLSDISTKALASTTIGTSDWTLADGTGGAREATIGQQADLTIDADGDADHVVVDDGTNYYVTTTPLQTLTSGGTVTVGSWTVTVGAPAAP